MRTRKTQNIKINMTCGSDFRLKKLYLFLHIFLTFSRENSRLGTSPPMMKSVWSHLKISFPGPSDKMSGDVEFGSDICPMAFSSFLTRK